MYVVVQVLGGGGALQKGTHGLSHQSDSSPGDTIGSSLPGWFESLNTQPNSWNSPQFSAGSEGCWGRVPVNDLPILFHGLSFSLFLLSLVTSEMP